MIRLQSFLLLIYVEALLKRKGFKYACETVKKKKKIRIKSIDSDKLHFICSKINKTVDKNIFFPHAECLQRSLVGYYILSKKGIDVDFCLGVSSDGIFTSHAWLETNGNIINDKKEYVEQYNKIMTF